MTTLALAPLPTVWPRAMRAPSTWRSPASPRSWRVSSTTWPRADAPRGSPFDSRPPLTFTGRRPPRPVAPPPVRFGPSPLGDHPQLLVRQQLASRVGVLALHHVEVGRAQTRLLVGGGGGQRRRGR